MMRIKFKVFYQIFLGDLNSEFKVNILIGFLDKHFANHDLADSLENFDDFDDFQRKDGQLLLNTLQCLMQNTERLKRRT